MGKRAGRAKISAKRRSVQVPTPKGAIEDLQRHLAANNFTLTDPAKSLFLEAERIAERLNMEFYAQVLLSALLTHFAPLRKLLIRQGLSPEDAVYRLEQVLLKNRFDEYSHEDLYSGVECRGGLRTRLIDRCVEVASRRRRVFITGSDVLEALLEEHDEVFPIAENSDWADKRLRVSHNTLSHIHGRFDPDLWISFDDVRRDLSLVSPAAARRAPVDKAPQRLRAAVWAFMADHPDYALNCFIIMPFGANPFYDEVIATLRKVLRALGFNPLRADDKTYSENQLANVETYLFGCHFAVSVHDRFLTNEHNNNVMYEVGYCLGLGKSVCFLTEQTVHSLPSDMAGQIPVPFDGTKIEESIGAALTKWLTDKGLSANPTADLAASRSAAFRLATEE